MFAGKFREDVDPKESLHPSNCQNPRERIMLEFLMPILNPEKPKRISLTMANTLFDAMSGVRPVNWGLLIHEVVGWAIPNIGRKPSYLSPFLLHLYRHYECITADEEDLLTIAAEEVTYKVRPTFADSSTSSDPIIPDAPLSSPGSPPPQRAPPSLQSFWRPVSPPPPPPQHPHPEAGPSRESTWQIVDPFAWDSPKNPFKRVHDELEELQTQYYRLEHLTKGASLALGSCGPGNILREIAKRADRKELDQAKRELDQVQIENAHLHAQVAAMLEELGQKSEDIRKYHAEQTVVFSWIRELIGHPGEIVNKARLYDQLVESEDLVSTRQTIPILVKYSQMMNNLFADIQKVVPPGGTPRRVLYQKPPGSPTGTLYEEVGEVALVQNPPTTADPSQQGGGSQLGSSGKDSFFAGQTEEFQVCEDRARTITRPQDFGSVPHSGQGPDSSQAPNSGSGGDSILG